MNQHSRGRQQADPFFYAPMNHRKPSERLCRAGRIDYCRMWFERLRMAFVTLRLLSSATNCTRWATAIAAAPRNGHGGKRHKKHDGGGNPLFIRRRGVFHFGALPYVDQKTLVHPDIYSYPF